MTLVPVSGDCDPAFETVRSAFADNFADRGEVGAAVCVIVDGRVVVDLVGGWSDADRTRLWQPDTLVNFYSVGKALIGLLALQLVESGQIPWTLRSRRVGRSSGTAAKARPRSGTRCRTGPGCRRSGNG